MTLIDYKISAKQKQSRIQICILKRKKNFLETVFKPSLDKTLKTSKKKCRKMEQNNKITWNLFSMNQFSLFIDNSSIQASHFKLIFVNDILFKNA